MSVALPFPPLFNHCWINTGILSLQSKLKSEGLSTHIGFSSSLTVILCVCVTIFPHPSSNIHVLITSKSLGQNPGIVFSERTPGIFPWHISVPFNVAGDDTSSAQSTVTSSGRFSGSSGSSISCTVIVADVVAVLPQSSVINHVLVITFSLGQLPSISLSEDDKVGILQLSPNAGVPNSIASPQLTI